jgi:hypothetical protein
MFSLWTSLAGSLAGLVAATAQVAVGKAEELLILPPGEDANIAPRFVQRLAERAGRSLPDSWRWALGTLFHYGYGAFWGALYALLEGWLAARRRPPPPLLGGAALGAVLYALAFSRLGLAVQAGTERPPERRPAAKTAMAWSVALTFGLVTATLTPRWRPSLRPSLRPSPLVRGEGRPGVP